MCNSKQTALDRIAGVPQNSVCRSIIRVHSRYDMFYQTATRKISRARTPSIHFLHRLDGDIQNGPWSVSVYSPKEGLIDHQKSQRSLFSPKTTRLVLYRTTDRHFQASSTPTFCHTPLANPRTVYTSELGTTGATLTSLVFVKRLSPRSPYRGDALLRWGSFEC